MRAAGGGRPDDPHGDQHSRFDYGFATNDIFTARLGLFEKDYPTPKAQRQFYDALMPGLEGRPGIRAVAFTSDLPARGGQMHPLTVDGVAYPTGRTTRWPAAS